VLFDNQLFSKFIYSYYRQNMATLSQFKDPHDFAQRFNQTDAAWSSLLQYAAKDYAINPGPVTPHDKTEIEQRIKTSLARQIWRMEGFYEVSNTYDPAVAKAMEVLRK
jgi:carboxyl-terminal processing protease